MTSRVKRAKYKAASEPYQTLAKCIRFEKKEKGGKKREKKKKKQVLYEKYCNTEFYEDSSRILIHKKSYRIITDLKM